MYGLLEAVLPGEDEWFGFHACLANKHWDGVWESTAVGVRLLPFRLPREPPQLLPILVNNYGLQAATDSFNTGPSSSKRPRTEGEPNKPVKRVHFQPSQFVYTLMTYLQVCDEIERSSGQCASSSALTVPKIRFRSNRGRVVIPFCPSVPVSIAVTEALSRPFAEIALGEFAKFYRFDPTECDVARRKMERRSIMQSGALDTLDINANEVFTREVELAKRRYLCLAEWLIKSVFPPPASTPVTIEDID
jgi:hypothetical protein